MGSWKLRPSYPVGMAARYTDNPRDHLRSLRGDLNLSSYDTYSNAELDKALETTERVFGVLRLISQREREPKQRSGFKGFVDRAVDTYDRLQLAIRGETPSTPGRTGILAIIGRKNPAYEISAPMDRPRAIPVNGRPFLDHGVEYIVYQLQGMARSGPGEVDGAYCFDLNGNLFDVGRRIVTPAEFGLNGTSEEVRKIKGTLGTKHEAAAFASKQGLISVALSEEVGTVITFIGGKVIPDYVYRPEGLVIPER